MHNMKPFIRV